MAVAAPATAAYIGLGSNLGDSEATLLAAFDSLGRLRHTGLVARSSLYRSAPVDAIGPDYLNAVAAIETRLQPHELLAGLHDIENAHGRRRTGRNAPRTLDLDLLLYGCRRIEEPGLTVPHPRLAERAFVLLPLHEIAPGLQLPGGDRIATLLAPLAGQRVVRL